MDLIAEQARIEARMSSLGVERFYKRAYESRESGEATLGKSVQIVLDATLQPLADAIRAFVDEANSGKAGRRHTAVRKLRGLDPSEIAFITAKIILDGLHNDQALVRLSTRIGRKIELEQRLRAFEKANPDQFRFVTNQLDKQTSHLWHRERVYQAMLRFGEGDGWRNWLERDCLLTGLRLIEMMVSATGLIVINTERTGKRTVSVVQTTERFKAWLSQLDQEASLMAPELLPCVIPPKPWTGLTGGGYHTDALLDPLSFVKTRNPDHLNALAKADLSRTMEAVNAIQDTPWAVNRAVFAVAEKLAEQGRAVAGLPMMEHLPLPAKPLDIDTNKEARTAWKREAAATHQFNRSLMSNIVRVQKTLLLARNYVRYDRIYFPHQLDFRGRVYAVPQVLNPQGTDLAKGLLRFAEGDPIGTPVSRDWFCIHGANCFGVDKVSFRDRVSWVDRHHEQILAVAANPLDDLWWAEADSPFCFLAWAFEYATFVDDPGRFRSHLPIAMDGSCNGLQHYSAMLQDPVGGKATNLVPSSEPQDIYAEVAKVVVASLYHTSMQQHHPSLSMASNAAEVIAEANLASAWGAFGIDRKITKRPVMVLPYGGTQSSCVKYVHEVAEKQIAEGKPSPVRPGEDLWPASAWLGNVVWQSIGEVVVAARLAMGWLRAVASVVSKENLPLQWTTPCGFPVVQSYRETKMARIETTLFGARFDPAIVTEVPATLDARRQVNGVAPNFVHSLDAAALILTVIEAKAQGVTKFAMIHDSYGTTAAHARTLGDSLREVFATMYAENEILENFLRDAVPQHLQQTVPPAPFVGGLDLNEIRSSPYFFA